jgi:hypothetical protein
LLFILVEPKYKAGASLPPTASLPSIFGARNFAVSSFKATIDFMTRAPLGIARAGCQHRSCKYSNREDKHPKDENSFGTWRRCGRRCCFIFGSSLVSGGFMPVL